MSEWKPIETAPKDGTAVLVYGVPCGEINGYWMVPDITTAEFAGEEWVVVVTDFYRVTITPTHWMPLPAPPEGGE